MSDTIELKVSGMSCHHCEMAVVKALKKIDGVTDAKADHQAGTATVEVIKDVTRQAMIDAIKEEGYEAN
jgi:copper chaperone